MAVALPVRTSIKDVYDDTCTELLVTAQLDSGAPRPRCTAWRQVPHQTCAKD